MITFRQLFKLAFFLWVLVFALASINSKPALGYCTSSGSIGCGCGGVQWCSNWGSGAVGCPACPVGNSGTGTICEGCGSTQDAKDCACGGSGGGPSCPGTCNSGACGSNGTGNCGDFSYDLSRCRSIPGCYEDYGVCRGKYCLIDVNGTGCSNVGNRDVCLGSGCTFVPSLNSCADLTTCTTGTCQTACGDTAVCTPPCTPVNGTCGSANGGYFNSVPVSNLCGSGTASAVSGSGPWTWTCAGSCAGSTANCNANRATSYFVTFSGDVTLKGALVNQYLPSGAYISGK